MHTKFFRHGQIQTREPTSEEQAPLPLCFQAEFPIQFLIVCTMFLTSPFYFNELILTHFITSLQFQAFDITAQNTGDVRTCQIQVIVEDVEEFVNNTWDFFDEVYMSYKNLMVDAAECLNDNSNVVSCISSDVISWMEKVAPEAEKYYSNLATWAEQFVSDVTSCV